MNFKKIQRAELNWETIRDNYDLLALYKHFYNKIELNKHVHSPFRNDPTPSFIVNYKNGDLLFKDFGGDKKSGNLMQFVAELLHKDYNSALLAIANAGDYAYEINNFTPTPKIKKQSNTLITPIFRHYNSIDVQYWSQYEIPLSLLVQYNIKPCKEVTIYKNDNVYTLYSTRENPFYAYCFIKHPTKFKIYMPYASNRFICNSGISIFEGWDQLNKSSETLFLTSSLKDVIVLRLLGYDAIAFQSESVNIPKEIIDTLRKRFKDIYVFFDFDDTGILYSNKFKEEHNIPTIFTHEADYKDPSDYIKEYGKQKLQILIDSQI